MNEFVAGYRVGLISKAHPSFTCFLRPSKEWQPDPAAVYWLPVPHQYWPLPSSYFLPNTSIPGQENTKMWLLKDAQHLSREAGSHGNPPQKAWQHVLLILVRPRLCAWPGPVAGSGQTHYNVCGAPLPPHFMPLLWIFIFYYFFRNVKIILQPRVLRPYLCRVQCVCVCVCVCEAKLEKEINAFIFILLTECLWVTVSICTYCPLWIFKACFPVGILFP